MSEIHDRGRISQKTGKPGKPVDARIEETERSLDFAKQFLENLESPDEATHRRVAEIAHSLERELDRLRTAHDSE